VNALSERNIGFRSLTENIATTSSGGKLVFHIFAAQAEFERELIRERTRAGLVAARARGRLRGRPTVMPSDEVTTARQMYDSKKFHCRGRRPGARRRRASIYRHLGVTGAEPGGDKARSEASPTTGPSASCGQSAPSQTSGRGAGRRLGGVSGQVASGPITVTSVPIGVYGHSSPALLTSISTQPLLWGKPYSARTNPWRASPWLK
jgi:hypothetical protein